MFTLKEFEERLIRDGWCLWLELIMGLFAVVAGVIYGEFLLEDYSIGILHAVKIMFYGEYTLVCVAVMVLGGLILTIDSVKKLHCVHHIKKKYKKNARQICSKKKINSRKK